MDASGLFDDNFSTTAPSAGATSTLQAAVNAGARGQWLILVRPQGILEVRDPKTLDECVALTI